MLRVLCQEYARVVRNGGISGCCTAHIWQLVGILWFELNINASVGVSDALVDGQDVLIVDNGCYFR